MGKSADSSRLTADHVLYRVTKSDEINAGEMLGGLVRSPSAHCRSWPALSPRTALI